MGAGSRDLQCLLQAWATRPSATCCAHDISPPPGAGEVAPSAFSLGGIARSAGIGALVPGMGANPWRCGGCFCVGWGSVGGILNTYLEVQAPAAALGRMNRYV